MIGTLVMTAAGVICLILPMDDFSKMDKIAVLAAIAMLLFMVITDWDGIFGEEPEDDEDSFRELLTMTTLPGKRHTLDIRTAGKNHD